MLEFHQLDASSLAEERMFLSSSQWDLLQGLGLTNAANNQVDSIETELLLKDEHCITILKKITPNIGSPNLKITASLVMKRMGFLTLAPFLFSMSRFNLGLNLELSNCIFEYSLVNRLWQSRMPLKNLTVQLSHGDRDSWRESVISKAFAGNLTRMVHQLHKITRVSQRILWENIAVRVFSIYERRILVDAPEALLMQIKRDYAWLVDPNNTSIFGLDYNPLSEFYPVEFFSNSLIESASEAPTRIRKTCCYYYKATDPSEYCSACPRLVKPCKAVV